MSFFEELYGPFKGRLKKKTLPQQGEIRVLNPAPVWIGMRDGTNIKRMMGTEEAERWVQEDTDRTVKLFIRKGELDKL